MLALGVARDRDVIYKYNLQFPASPTSSAACFYR
jgi:hypothetical protein